MDQTGHPVGTLIKSHGFRGDMILKGTAETLDNIKEGMPLFFEIEKQRVPFFIEKISVDPIAGSANVKFEFIDSDRDADRYRGCAVFAETGAKIISNAEERNELDLTGYSLKDEVTGRTFNVTNSIPDPENPLLVLDAEEGEVLVPAKADFLLKIDHEYKKIIAEFPPGLLDQD